MAQKVVNTNLAFGVEGEFYDSSIKRCVNRKLSTDGTFGQAVFLASDGATVTPAYDSSTAPTFAGIVVNPKEYINRDANLASSMKAQAGSKVGVADLGRVIVKAANAVKVGDKAFTCVTAGTATGTTTVNYAVGSICGGTAAPATSDATGGVFVEISNAMFDIVSASAGEAAVLVLSK